MNLFTIPIRNLRRAAAGSNRRRPAGRRPTLERLETLNLLTVIPLTGGTFVDKAYSNRDYNGLADFATYDTTTSTFNIDVNDGAPNQDKIAVKVGNPAHNNVPVVGNFFSKSGVYAGLNDFGVYDATTATFHLAPNNGSPNAGQVDIQIGDPSHNNIPLVGNYSAFKNSDYLPLSDFTIYDETTATYHVDVNNGDPYHNKIDIPVGDPTHTNTPVVGRYSFYKGVAYTALDDFATYDQNTATYNIDVNGGAPNLNKIQVQVGDPSHHNIPLGGDYSAFKSANYSPLFDFATYDENTATYNIDVNNGDPHHNKIAVPIGNPADHNIPVLGSFSPYKYAPYNTLNDFATYDQTTATYNIDANGGDPFHQKIAVQIGDPTHVNTPLLGQYSAFKPALYQGMNDFATYDSATSTFNIDVNNGDPYHNKVAIQLGDPTHAS